MIVIIGIGNIGRELLRKLSRDFEVTCIDTCEKTTAVVEEIRGTERTKVIVGDATSRLVLEQAGIDESEAVIITTTTEKISQEIARLLKEHFTPRRVISVGLSLEGAQKLAELGVEVKNIFTASANDIRNLIEHQAKTAYGIGIGKNEILEVEVHPNSRLKNKRLGSIAPIRWNLGIIYRDGNPIVPKPDTVLKEGDKVIILGDPGVLKTVAELLTFDFQSFPLEFGTAMVVYLNGNEDERFYEEMGYVYSVFHLGKVYLVYSAAADKQAGMHDRIAEKYGFQEAYKTVSSLAPVEALRALLLKEPVRPGLLFLSGEMLKRSLFSSYGLARKKFVSSLARVVQCPIVFARGSFPYEKLVVPALEETGFRHFLDTAIEISHTINNEVCALMVKPSGYIATREETDAFDEARQIISNTGLMHRKKIFLQIHEGNPVLEVTRYLPDYNLLVLGVNSWSEKGFFRSVLAPEIGWQILIRSNISSLVLPFREEVL